MKYFEIEFDNEPENFIEGITLLIKTIKFNFGIPTGESYA